MASARTRRPEDALLTRAIAPLFDGERLLEVHVKGGKAVQGKAEDIDDEGK